MARRRRKKGKGGLVFGFLVAAAVAAGIGLVYLSSPTGRGETRYVRFKSGTTLDDALRELSERNVIRNPGAAKVMIRLKGLPSTVKTGTFEVRPGMSLDQVMQSLQKPVRRMVRIPEGWWVARVGARLEENDVCKADDYIRLAAQPEKFAQDVDFKLPEKSLEGYLYPDTYDLPPLLDAEDVIRMQLKAFESKVVKPLKPGAKLNRAVIMGSIIELEAAKDDERAKVAGVIENRLRKGQRLEMDATVLYGIQEWRELGPGEVRNLKSDYNTYLHSGLTPGPIGSPGAKSIAAALKPDSHNLLYYVARPDRTHYFSATYPEHIENIKKARREWREGSP